MNASKRRSTIKRNFPRRRSPIPASNNRGISIWALTKGNRSILENPGSRLTAMKSRLLESSLGNKQRVQLGKRIILTAFQVGRLNKNGRISNEVLGVQTFGRIDPILFRACLTNLIRKGKISRFGKDWVQTIPPSRMTRIA